MPDFNKLKPLKYHRTILTVLILVLLIILIFTPKNFFQWNNSVENNSAKVVAKSGLKIRQSPNLDAEIITTVKFGENINIIDKETKNDFVNGETGKWYKIEYENKIGFAWSKYISD